MQTPEKISSGAESDQLLYNIAELMTCEPLTSSGQPVCRSEQDLGLIQNAWLLIRGGKVSDYGQGAVPEHLSRESGLKKTDTRNSLVLPGLTDSHTHPLFAGNRSREFAMRLNGMTYQEIARQGGGIRASVEGTRQATDETLKGEVQKNLNSFLTWGVTSVEVKSGYGLSAREELRHLRILNAVRDLLPQTLVTTCLALHSLPPEFSSFSAYIAEIQNELLPQVAEERLAAYVDAFIEQDYFSVSGCEVFMQAAADAGLGIRVHADEFSDAGGAQAAADWAAASADHLQFASSSGIRAMASAEVVATVLPGTSLYTAIPFTNAGKFREAGCAIAVASDFNPGSCYIRNLPLLAALSGLHCGLKSWEVMAGITRIPACSLGLGSHKGALARGFDADLLIHSAGNHQNWLADLGQTPPTEVHIRGRKVLPLAG